MVSNNIQNAKMISSIASGLVRERPATSITQSQSSGEESPIRRRAAGDEGGAKSPIKISQDQEELIAEEESTLRNSKSRCSDDASSGCGGDVRRSSRLLGIKSLLRESSKTLAEGLMEEQKTTDHVARGEVYDGPYLNGQRHGDGVVCTMSNAKFLGSYRHDEPFEGTMISNTYTYTGTFAAGKYHGPECKLAMSDGTTYEGEFRCGLYHGAGKLVLPDGSSYTGTFENGKRHGVGMLLLGSAFGAGGSENGTRTSASGDGPSYSGEWADDLREGEGTEKLATGEAYHGHFSRNKPHGAGSLTGTDGTVREGVWRGGVPVDGPGWTITYPSGDKYVGCTVNMKPHGIGTLKYNSGPRKGVYNGEFERGVRHGMGLLVYNNGDQFDGLWVDDEPNMSKKDTGKVEIMARLRQACGVGRTEDDVNTVISALTMEEQRTLIEEYGEVQKVKFTPSSHRADSRDQKSPSSSTGKGLRASLFSLKDELVKPSTNTDEDHVVADRRISECSEEKPKKSLHRFGNGDTFHGYMDAKGRRQGRGMYIESKSGTTYEGNFLDNMQHGLGILITPVSKYDGDWKFDEREGQGTLVLNESISYSGGFKGGKYHGEGMLCDGNGRVYFGLFQHGMFDGQGSMTYPDGKIYNGGWKRGERSGWGTLKEEGVDGRPLYEGHWLEDMRHGRGTNYYVAEAPIGDNAECPRFEGSFFRNQREGIGRNTFADGVFIEGPYHCNHPVDGDWIIRQADGSFFSGKATFEDGEESDVKIPEPNGFGTKTYSNGDKYKGHFVRGRRHGSGTCNFANGYKWEGTWIEDQFDDGCVGTLRLADGSRHAFGHEYSTEYRDGSSTQS